MLEEDEAHPAEIVNRDGGSPFLFVCEHADRKIPRNLGNLGLGDGDLARHIAWDIGAASVARQLAGAFDATLVLQRYSRLVVDCNRPPRSPAAMPEISERTAIPGNEAISEAEREARIAGIFDPFHDALAGLLDERLAAGRDTTLVTVHSFNRTYDGFERPWHVGAQYNRGPGFSQCINALLAQDRTLCIGDNQPYPVNDETHYTIPVHGERRGITHTMLEVQNDLIKDAQGQMTWAERLAGVLRQAVVDLGDRRSEAPPMTAREVGVGDA
ncbi:MAG: N-formylglutamate amidohydrolase [Hyphomicrobiales bacterium]